MAFKEVASLDADVVIALGKTDKKTGKKSPTEIEGYFLGTRTVVGKKGDSSLHFLQTGNGNVGVWGTTDLNRKLGQVTPGTMVQITSTGTKPTPNGDMYTYRVAQDSENTIDVAGIAAASNPAYADDADDTYGTIADTDDQEDSLQSAALAAAERKAKVEALLKSGKARKLT